MTVNTFEQHRTVRVSEKARALRPDYFAKLDTLLASGAFAVEDLRKTHPPTGRRYAD